MRRNKFRKETVRRIVNQTLSQSVPPSIVTGISGYTKLMLGILIERARDIQEQNAAVAAAYPSPPSQPMTATTGQPNGAASQNTAPPSSSFASTATIPYDTSFGNQSFDTQHGHPDPDSDTDRPPDLNHNDIFGNFSSPPRPPNPPFSPTLTNDDLKPLPQPTRRVERIPIDSSAPSLPRSSQDTTPPRKPAKKTVTIDRKNLGPLLPDDFREALRRYKRDGESAGIGQGGLSLMGIGVHGSIGAGRGKGKRLFG